MGVKHLYRGGFGDYTEFAVAESEAEAIDKIALKIGAKYLPVTASVIDGVDGYSIVAKLEPTAAVEEAVEDELAPEHAAEKEETIRRCKKCDFTCTNQAVLMKHYRDEHPKGA